MAFIISLLFVIFGCENVVVSPNDVGTIEGKVTIGPLCGNVPIQTNNTNPCGFSDETLDAIYAKYKVEIKGENNGKVTTQQAVLNRTGLFSFQVPVGSYDVEVVIPAGSAVQNSFTDAARIKKGVSVTKNQVVTLQLDVSTGIQ